MDSWTRVYLGSLAFVLAVIGLAPAQDGADEFADNPVPPPAVEDLGVIVDVEDVAADATAEEVAELEELADLVDDGDELADIVAEGEELADIVAERAGLADIASNVRDVVYPVRLCEDGHVHGRVRIAYPTGKTIPAGAVVTFNLKEKLIESAETDERGLFEVANLRPGRYIVTALIETGSTQFTVDVLPYDASAAPEEMLLDILLSYEAEPMMDDLGCATYCGCDGGCGGGFGGGGYAGGGLGWLLGAGGLAAGITALALDGDDGVVVVSPFQP